MIPQRSQCAADESLDSRSVYLSPKKVAPRKKQIIADESPNSVDVPESQKVIYPDESTRCEA